MPGPSAQQPNASEDSHPAEPPLSEPLIVPTLSVSDLSVETDDHLAHFVGWVTTQAVAGDSATAERRIVVRIDLPSDRIRPLRDRLTQAIPRGH